MSLNEWKEMAEAITVGGPLPIRFSCRLFDESRVVITGMLETMDVTIPEHKTHLQTQEIFDSKSTPTENIFLDIALKLYEHECREWIKCGDHRFAKPH